MLIAELLKPGTLLCSISTYLAVEIPALMVELLTALSLHHTCLRIIREGSAISDVDEDTPFVCLNRFGVKFFVIQRVCPP